MLASKLNEAQSVVVSSVRVTTVIAFSDLYDVAAPRAQFPYNWRCPLAENRLINGVGEICGAYSDPAPQNLLYRRLGRGRCILGKLRAKKSSRLPVNAFTRCYYGPRLSLLSSRTQMISLDSIINS